MNTVMQNTIIAARRKSIKDEQGFSLIETSVALVVMMVVGLGAASLFMYALGSNTTARDRELSMAVAQQQMERLRTTSFENLDATIANLGGAEQVTHSFGRSYTVATTAVNTVAGNATDRTITVQVTPHGSSNGRGVSRIFGGVTLVTRRTTNAVGPNVGP